MLAALGYQFLLALLVILLSFHAFASAGVQACTAAAMLDLVVLRAVRSKG